METPIESSTKFLALLEYGNVLDVNDSRGNACKIYFID